MKRLEEHSKEELLGLTTEQIAELIDLESAHAGIRLLPEVPIKPDLKKPEADMTIYKIEGATFCNKEDALAVADLMMSFARCHYYSWSTDGVKPNTDAIAVKHEKAFSPNHAAQTAGLKADVERRQKEYDNLKNEFDAIQKERKGVVESVMEKVSEAQAERNRIDNYKREFTRYMKLANNDAEIAFNFLLSTRKEEAEFIEKLKIEISIDRMVNSAQAQEAA